MRVIGGVVLSLLLWSCRTGTTRQTIELGEVLGPPTIEADGEGVGGDAGIVVSFDDPPADVTSGQTITRSFSITSDAPITRVQLAYSRDGQTVTEVFELEVGSSVFSFVIPTELAAAARLRLSAATDTGKIGWRTSSSFAIVAPALAALQVERVSSANTHSPTVTYRVTDCAGYALLYETEAMAPPANASWRGCEAMVIQTTDVEASDGIHTLRIFGQLASGGISPPSTITFNLDTTPPAPPTATLVGSPVRNYRETLVALTSCDVASVLVSTSQTLAPPENDPAFEPCDTSFTRDLADLDGDQAIYIWGRDLAGNVSRTATKIDVTLDRVAPLVSLPELDATTALRGSTSESIAYDTSDLNLDMTASVRVEISNDNGATWSTAGLALGQPYDLATSFSLMTGTSRAGVRVRVFVQDLAGNEGTTESPSFIITSVAPVLSKLWLNGETGSLCPGTPAVTTAFETAQATLSVTDSIGALITHVCFRTRSAVQPLANDLCWRAVPTPAAQLDITVPVGLGYVKGPVTVRAWTKNKAGVVSVLKNSGAGADCEDKRATYYDPGDPPVVDNVTSFVTETPSKPYTQADVTLVTGPVYIKWNALFPNSMPGGSPGPIELEYSLNNAFSFQPIASNLTNSTNATTCTIGAGHTGCYAWNAPQAVRDAPYVQVRVRATNARGIAAATTAPVPVNQWPVRFLVGNTDPGYGGHALSTLFMSHITERYIFRPNTLAVSSLGVVYFYDDSLGLLWVNPRSGEVEALIPRTGVSNDDPSGLSAATIYSVLSMTIDRDDNLVFMDVNQLRRLNVGANKTPEGAGVSVETLVNGNQGTIPFGMDKDPLTETPIAGYGGPIAALDNGDIYFPSYVQTTPVSIIRAVPGGNTGMAMMRYYESDHGPRVDSIYFSGDGYWRKDTGFNAGTPGYDNFASFGMTFDVQGPAQFFLGMSDQNGGAVGIATYNANGVASPAQLGLYNGIYLWPYGLPHTGADGKLYYWDIWGPPGLLRYDPGTYLQTPVPQRDDLFTRIIGGGAGSPPCTDGMLALSCKLDLQDFFVDRSGVPYLLAQGEVFVVSESGTLVRIFGQSYDVGRTGPAQNVRFGYIPTVDKWRDKGSDSVVSADDRDRIVTVDSLTLRIEESILANDQANADDAMEGTTTHLAGNGFSKPWVTGGYPRSSFVQFDGSQSPPGNGVTGAVDLPLMLNSLTTIAVDPDGVVYFDRDEQEDTDIMVRLRRDLSEPKWEPFAGGGAVPYSLAGPTGPSGIVALSGGLGSQRSIWGYHDGSVIVATNSSHFDGYMLAITADATPLVDNVMTRLAGDLGSWDGAPFCVGPSGTSAPTPKEDCHLTLVYQPISRRMVHHDGFDTDPAAIPDPAKVYPAGWLIEDALSGGIYNFPDENGRFATKVPTNGLTLTQAFALRLVGSSPHLYTCGAGVLLDIDLESDTSTPLAMDFPLFYGVPNFQCAGTDMVWDEARHALRFTYVQNGLYGVAEYVMP